MGGRFRKSINLGPGVKLNASKKGIGMSAGVKGLRISRGADGKKRVTASLPGSGLSYTKTLKAGRSDNSEANERIINQVSDEDRRSAGFAQDIPLYTFSGQLEQYYNDGEGDTYYEKFSNILIFKDRIEVT